MDHRCCDPFGRIASIVFGTARPDTKPIANRDRIVSKDDLIASVWDGRIVSDSTLTSRINTAREAVGDTGKDQKLIRAGRCGIRQRGDFVGTHRVTDRRCRHGGTARSRQSRRVALQDLRRAQPDISLAWIAELLPIKQDAEREHYLEGFRRAV
jgi:hypothetical protein